jgi:hypothetical protein
MGMITQKTITAMTATGTVAASIAEVDHLGAMIGAMSSAEIAATIAGGADDVPSDASDISSVSVVPARHTVKHEYRTRSKQNITIIVWLQLRKKTEVMVSL